MAVVGVAGATGISEKAAAKQYLAISVPLNAAANKLVNLVGGWTNKITNAKAGNQAKPAIAAVLTFNRALASDAWPPSARSDVTALRKADAPLVADLRSLSSENLQNPSPILADFSRDESALGSAANVLRYDLGLPSTTATTPTNPALSGQMMGTADPKIPPIVPGKVAIVESASPFSKDNESTVSVMVANGTSSTISHLVVGGSAIDSTGTVVGTGESQGFSPWNVAPGQVSLGYVFFDSAIPAGARLQLSVTTYNSGVSPIAIDLKVTQAESKSDGIGSGPDEIVGSITNGGTTAVSVPAVEAQVYCFNSKGALTGESEGGVDTGADGNPAGTVTDLMPGAAAKFSVGLIEPPCPTFLVGAWGLAPSQ